MILALAAGLLLQAPQEPAKLTLDIPACRIEVLVDKLAAAGKTHLEIAQNLKGEVVTVRVKDVRLQDLLERIGKTLYAHWVPIQGGQRLEQAPELKQAEEKAEETERLSEVKDLLAQKAKEVGDLKPLTQKEIAAALESRRKLIEQMRKQAQTGNDGAPQTFDTSAYEQNQNMQARAPIGRLAARLALAIDPQVLANLNPGDRFVYATNPTRMQRPMSWGSSAVADFVREQNALAAIADAAPKPKQVKSDDPEMQVEDFDIGMGVSTHSAKDVSKVLLYVTRDAMFTMGMYRFEVKVVGKDGAIAFQTTDTMRAKNSAFFESGPPQPAKGDVPEQLSEDTKQLLSEVQAATQDRQNQAMPEVLRKRLAHPLTDEPIGIAASDVLASAYPGKNVVARLPDEWFLFGIATAFLPSVTVNVTQKLVKESNIFTDLSDGDWEVLGPRLSVSTRTGRIDRGRLERYLGGAAKGFASLDEYADAAHGLPNPTQNPMMMILSMLDPIGGQSMMFGMGGSSTNWETIQFYGCLPAAARQALRQSTPFAFGQLPQEAKLAMVKVIYQQPEQITSFLMIDPVAATEAMPDDMSGWPEIWGEPTESIPNGIMPETVVKGDLKSETVAAVDNVAGMLGLETMGPEEIGQMLAMRESNPAQGFDPATTKLRVGVRETLGITLQFGPKAFAHETLTWASMGKETQLLSAFPAEFRKAVEEARKQAKEAGPGDPDEVPVPPRRTPPPR